LLLSVRGVKINSVGSRGGNAIFAQKSIILVELESIANVME